MASHCTFEPVEARRLMAGTPTLVLNGTDGPDSIEVKYVQLAGAHTYLVKVNGASAQYYNHPAKQIVINGKGGGDKLTLGRLKFGTTAQINAGAGDDLVILGENYEAHGIDGPVTIDGGAGSDLVKIDHSQTKTPQFKDIYRFYDNKFDWGGINSGGAEFHNSAATFAGVEHVRLDALLDDSVIEMKSTVVGTGITVNGGNGNNTFKVGSGDLDGRIKERVTLNAGGGANDSVWFDDQSDSSVDTYTLTSNKLAKTGGMADVMFSGFENFKLDASGAAGTVLVQSVVAGFKTFAVNGGGGADKIELGTGDIGAFIRSRVQLDGGTGDDTLNLRDATDSGNDTYFLNNAKFYKSGYDQAQLARFEKLQLFANTGSNTIKVKPSLSATIGVFGGDQKPGIGDVLDVDFTGTDNPRLNRGLPGMGRYGFSNRKFIEYFSIEQAEAVPGQPNPSQTVFLSDRNWESATSGWGPIEKDESNGEQPAGDGRQITLNGETHNKGLGVHSSGEIVYALNRQFAQFFAEVGIDDEVGSRGSVVFKVILDGNEVFNSGVMTGNSTTKHIAVDTTGHHTMNLVVTDAGDGKDFDHADWASARLITATGSAPLAVRPSALTDAGVIMKERDVHQPGPLDDLATM